MDYFEDPLVLFEEVMKNIINSRRFVSEIEIWWSWFVLKDHTKANTPFYCYFQKDWNSTVDIFWKPTISIWPKELVFFILYVISWTVQTCVSLIWSNTTQTVGNLKAANKKAVCVITHAWHSKWFLNRVGIEYQELHCVEWGT